MKKALSAVLAVVLVLGVCFSVPMIASANNTDPFTYELDNAENPTGYIITGVKEGVEGTVEIPATYKPEGDIELFYPKTQNEPNVGEFEVTTTVSPSAEAGTAVVTDNEGEAVVTIDPADGYTLKSITVGETPVAELPTAVEGVYTYTFTPESDVTVAVVFEEETPAPATYTVTIDAGDVDGCSVVADKTTVTEGEDVVLTITTADGYELTAFTVDGVDKLSAISEGEYTVENVEANVAVVATFTAKAAPKFAITDCTVDGKGSATATVDEAAAGDPVTVEVTEEEGYALKTLKYTYNDGEAKSADITKGDAGYSFTMPAYPVTIEAIFVEVFAITGVNTATGKVTASVAEAEADAKVTLTVDPEDGYQLVAGSLKVMNGETEVALAADNSFTMPAAAVTVTAEFEAIEYKATVATGIINGKVEATAKRGETAIADLTKLNIGDTVTLALTIDKGCELKADSLKVSYIDGEETKTVTLTTVKANEEYTFSMPAADVTISAQIIPSELDVIGIAADAFQGENAEKITAFTVAAGQTRFVAKDGVLFEKVTTTTPAATEGGEATTTTTLKLIAFPANYTVAENAAKTYTIPATVDTLAVTAVANGAFQALGNVEYVFCAGNVTITESAQPAFTSNKKFHTTANHTEGAGYTKTPATCMAQGVTAYKCTYCEAELRTTPIAIDADAHTYGEWNVITEATCLVKGTRQKTCINTDGTNTCGHVYTEIVEKTQHNYSTEFTVDTKATCEDGDVNTVNTGSKSRHCTTPGCDAKTDVTTIPALTHEITDNKGNENIISKTEATCTKDGSVTGNCDHCGNVVTLTLTKTGHKYIEVVDAEATCTVNGWQHEECEYCGDYLDGSDMELKAPGHVAATVKNGDKVELKWTVVKAPTCSEDGFAEVRCANCGIQMVDPEGKIEYTRVLPKTGKHEFKDYTETKAATCDEEGSKTGTCACGATDVVEIDALGHKWAEEYTVDTAATCTKKGSESIKCTVCGDKNEDSVRETALAAHTADDSWKTVDGKAATCYAEGEKAGKCAVCGADATLPIEKLAHKWAAEAVNLKANIAGKIQDTNEDGTPKVDAEGKPVMVDFTYTAPTCENKGYKVIYCENTGCTAHKEDSLILVDALGHDLDANYDTEKPSNVQPTCDEKGTKYVWCKTCKAYVGEDIPATGHKWATEAVGLKAPITIKVEQVDVNGKVVLGKDGKPVMVDKEVTAPDCLNAGYTAIYCDTCGDYKDVTAVKALGHTPLYSTWTKDTTAATCTTKQFETNVCARTGCGAQMKQDTGDFAACVFETTYTFDYPTCEEAGRKYYKCSNDDCDKISGEVAIDALGHKFAPDAKFVGTDATCTEDGVKVKECLNCFEIGTGKPYEEPATGDSTGGTEQNGTTPVTEGDGTEGGTTTTTRPAAPAGYKYCEGYKVVTPATGHAFSDDYEEDLAATCEVAGKESRHCTNEDCTAKTGERAIAKLGHNYSTEYKTVTPATCKAEGKEARYCLNKDCESYTGERKLAKADHTYNDRTWKTVEGKAATCEKTGYEYNNCTVCNERAERESKALGHKWAETWTIVDATCEGKGQSYKACERAGCTAKSELEETPALGHKLRSTDAGYTKVDQTATNKCTVTGYEEGYCHVCNENNKNNLGKIRINVVESVGHKFDETPETVQATCVEKGSVTGKCSICGLSNVSNEIPAKGHTFGEWEMRKDDSGDQLFDSCKTEDSMVRYCTVKNCNGYEYGENEEHTESGWILDSDATCSTNGKMHTECTVCKFEMNKQTLYATDAHEYEEDTTKRVEPTCNTAGSKTLVCKNCKTEKTETIKATDHTFTEWKVFVEPTCTEKGIRQSVCTVCLTTKSEKILALGHDLGKDVITAPTCTVAGSKHQECSRCDYKTTATPIAALGHNYTTSNTCSAEGCDAQLYEYKLIGESTTDIEITKYNGNDANLVIPAEIDGYIVKAIGERAFMKIEVVKGAEATETTPAGQDTTKCEKSTIETVTIPETVTTIGAYAFASASDKFKSVVIPGTVTTIGDYAFGYNATITWVEDTEAQVEQGAVRPLKETISVAQVADFAIYGVKDSAAAVYAAQDAKNANDDFKFAAIADIYEVAIPEEFTEVAEKSSDNVVLFKDFVEYAADATNKKSIAEQIAAVVDINVSGYSVEVVASQSYKADENAAPVNFYGTGTKVLVKEGNNVVDVIEIAVQGDVNGDGVCDAIDCMLIQLAAAANSTRPLEGVYYTAGNITADSAITADDLSAAVLKIFGEDLVVEEPTTEPTTQAPASTEPSTEGTSDESTPAESTPAESTPAATESQPASSEPAATTTTTQAPATTTTTENSAA